MLSNASPVISNKHVRPAGRECGYGGGDNGGALMELTIAEDLDQIADGVITRGCYSKWVRHKRGNIGKKEGDNKGCANVYEALVLISLLFHSHTLPPVMVWPFSSRYHYSGTRRVHQLALGCDSS